jgi:hypothetical protein
MNGDEHQKGMAKFFRSDQRQAGIQGGLTRPDVMLLGSQVECFMGAAGCRDF